MFMLCPVTLMLSPLIMVREVRAPPLAIMSIRKSRALRRVNDPAVTIFMKRREFPANIIPPLKSKELIAYCTEVVPPSRRRDHLVVPAPINIA
jgi:hypothetical protein